MKPTVSVVMPCLNERKNLPRSIKSVVNQTLTDWELIVVDDGSSDGSADYVEQLANTDPRIRCVRNIGHHGVAACLNLAISMARGEFIARLDADDESDPERLELMVRRMRSEATLGVLGCGVIKQRWSDGALVEVNRFALPDDHQALVNSLAYMVGIGANCLVRREVFERVGGYDPCIGAEEELEFLIRAAKLFRLGYLAEPLYVYNVIEGKGRSVVGKRLKKKLILAGLNLRAIRELNLPLRFAPLAFGWILFGLMPERIKALVRNRLGFLVGRYKGHDRAVL